MQSRTARLTADHDRKRLNERDAAAWLHCARRGELEAAWRCSDRILERTRGHRDSSVPRHQQQVWDGTSFEGRRVFIRCYHGLGDTIQFIRYMPFVRALASEVTVWAQPALLPLVNTVAGIDRTVPLHEGSPDVHYDVDAEIMELPWIFRSTLESIPRQVPYLAAAAAPLPPGDRPRVGVVWRAGEWDVRRSIAFGALTALLDFRGVAWYQLQHEIQPGEQHPGLHRLDTAGLQRLAQYIRALDLVITIDSMPAHLAGALGVPVWTLLPHEADWRWMEGRDDSPWYPTMRLFRQPVAGDWQSVLGHVKSALAAEFAG